MAEDYRCAITWAGEQSGLGPARVAVSGTSLSGGRATWMATVDKRVHSVVAQAPSMTGMATRRALEPVMIDKLGRFLLAESIERCRGGRMTTNKIVSAGSEPCAVPGAECRDALMAPNATAPIWRNEITIASLEQVRSIYRATHIAMVAPAALLVIAAEHDSLSRSARCRPSLRASPIRRC